MLFDHRPRVHYENAVAHEVICQLRFPTILSINSTEPAEFQEAIRDTFPQYIRRQEAPPPKFTPQPDGKMQVERQTPISNYHFLSADGKWKLNLTRDFIALSTLRYNGWEEFAQYLDKPLAYFIQLYHPAYFQRVGLRYVNIISREKLGLEGTPWTDLIAPAYTGALKEPDVREEDCLNCGADLLLRLDNSCRAKIHAGPGRVKSPSPNVPQDPEMKFVLDLDLSMTGNVSPTMAAAALETLHVHGGRIFEGAITDRLREAMEPV